MMNLRVTLRSLRVCPRPFTPLASPPPPAPPRYFPSRSLRLSRSPPYSPPLSLSDLGVISSAEQPGRQRPPSLLSTSQRPTLLLPAVLLPLPFFSAPWPAAGEERRAEPLCSVAGGGGGEARRGPSAPWPAAGRWRHSGPLSAPWPAAGRGGAAVRRQGGEGWRGVAAAGTGARGAGPAAWRGGDGVGRRRRRPPPRRSSFFFCKKISTFFLNSFFIFSDEIFF
ncbi:hypothetical protein PVAP13_9KG523078 [Panicum virgatum]|uniref:Uncharacterized protein n=1 Tax=Panicum virgatum TaxID=38727 RepID=A0A8T0NXG3_PANVG|nr:hypothetical protein PVAP13_9KG523078 [Panicum virgatum]